MVFLGYSLLIIKTWKVLLVMGVKSPILEHFFYFFKNYFPSVG
jgi:hypothetical protein